MFIYRHANQSNHKIKKTMKRQKKVLPDYKNVVATTKKINK